MSELLDKANELTTLNVKSRCGPHYDGWPCFGKYPCMYTDDALYVIKGYQDLLRQVLSLCESRDPFYNQDIAERWDWLIGKIEKALPQEANDGEA